jgi:hypothetical protein
MNPHISHDEEAYLRHFLTHGVREQHTMHILANLFLLFGGIIIIGTIVYLLKSTTDTVVFVVALPGIVSGLMLILLYVVLSKKEQHDRTLYGIISKLVS